MRNTAEDEGAESPLEKESSRGAQRGLGLGSQGRIASSLLLAWRGTKESIQKQHVVTPPIMDAFLSCVCVCALRGVRGLSVDGCWDRSIAILGGLDACSRSCEPNLTAPELTRVRKQQRMTTLSKL